MTTTNQTQQHITSLGALKVLAVIGILLCHTGLIPQFDACARMVEILFLLSGFLMAYNYHDKITDYSLLHGWCIISKKLKRIYPVHIITFLLQLFFVATWWNKSLNYKLGIGFLNLTFQHAWFIPTEFSFNNVSWFLSALLFAYLLTPTITGLTKCVKSTLKLFVSILFVRFFIEYLIHTSPKDVSIDLHCNPLVQTLNYTLGYILGSIFIKENSFNTFIKEKIDLTILSIIQLMLIIIYFLCCQRFDGTYRIFFIILSLPLIYSLAINKGYIVKLITIKPIIMLEAITLEIFMFHSFILYHFPTDINKPITYLTFFILTLSTSLIYHIIYKLVTNKTPKNKSA